MSPFVCLFKPVVYGLYAGAQLTEYGGDLFLFVGRNEPFAFAAGEVEAAARKAALYLPSHLAYHFAGHFVIQLRHSAGVPAGCGTAEECTAAFAFQCGDVARVYGAYHDLSVQHYSRQYASRLDAQPSRREEVLVLPVSADAGGLYLPGRHPEIGELQMVGFP